MGPRTDSFKAWFKTYFITLLILLAIGLGAALAALLLLYVKYPKYQARNVMYVGFAGELIIRGISCMSLPVAVTGIILGVVRLRLWLTFQLLGYTILYIILTKALAVFIGVGLSAMLIPNSYHIGVRNRTRVKVMELTENITSVDNFLDCIRNLFPPNIITMSFKRYKTVLIPRNTTVNSFMWAVNREGMMEDGVNYFGVANYSIVFGIALLSLSYKAGHVQILFDTLYLVVKKISGWLLFISPIFCISVIAGAAMDAENRGFVYADIGPLLLVVILGQAMQCLLVYPIVYFTLCYANPLPIFAHCSDALLLGFVSGSSWVALPITLLNLEARTDITPTLTRFVIPFSHIFNKGGTTVFITASLLATFRMKNWAVHLGKLFAFSLLGGFASAASDDMPYSNILCIMMGVRSFDMMPNDVASFMAVDWLVRRTGTLVDVLGDVYLVHLFAAYYATDFMKEKIKNPD